MPAEIEPAHPDRRKHRRFPLGLDLRYTLASGQSGVGVAANMSTGGLLFRGAIQLPIGELIEVVMAWPFLLNENQVLELRLRGMIVRSTPAETAISISKHEIHPAPEPEG